MRLHGDLAGATCICHRYVDPLHLLRMPDGARIGIAACEPRQAPRSLVAGPKETGLRRITLVCRPLAGLAAAARPVSFSLRMLRWPLAGRGEVVVSR